MRTLFLSGCLLCLSAGVVLGQSQEPEFSWVNPLPDSAHHRLRHETFHSSAMNTEVGYNIYLPLDTKRLKTHLVATRLFIIYMVGE